MILLPPVERTEDPAPRTPRRGGTAAGMPAAPADGAARRHRRQVIRRSLLIVGFILLALVTWVGVRGGLAAAAVSSGWRATDRLIPLLTEQNEPRARTEIDRIQRSAAEAHALTSDVVWRTVEFVPLFGGNLTTVRESLTALDQVSADALDPLVDLSSAVEPATVMEFPLDVRLARLKLATAPLAKIDVALGEASDRLAAIDTSGNIGVLDDNFGLLRQALRHSADAAAGLSELSVLIPSLTVPSGVDTWDIAITAQDERGVTRPVAYLGATTAGGRFTVTQVLDASSGHLPVGQAPGNLTVGVATLELLTTQFGPVQVSGVGEIVGTEVGYFVGKGAYEQAASPADGQRAIGRFAETVISRLLN